MTISLTPSRALNRRDSWKTNKFTPSPAGKFGGATSTPAKGGWRSASGELVIEDVNIVYSYCTPEQADKSFKQILELCQYIKSAMKQEAVTLEYNNQIAFV